MLSAQLSFIYLDPVLTNHLGPQAELLVGRSLLEYVHPDEQASAKQDLGGVLQSRTLHGSVTWCVIRFFASNACLKFSDASPASVSRVSLKSEETSDTRGLPQTGPTLTKSPMTRTTWVLTSSSTGPPRALSFVSYTQSLT